MKYHVLYNPLAGIGDCFDKLEELKVMYGEDAEIKNVTEIDDFGEYLETFDDDDKIIVCGGDGTLNRFINNRIEKHKIKHEVLYFAQGTGNDFLRDVKDEDVTKPSPLQNT